MLSFAKKRRFPTIKDRYSFRFGRFIPNPDLKAEEAYHYEVGYSKKFGDDFRLNAAIFYSDIRKKFETIVVQTKPKKIGQFQNIGNSDIYGFEFEAHANLMSNLKMGANYTYMHADSGKDGVYLTGIPKHKGFLYADLKIAPKFSLYISQEGETGRQSNSDGTFKPGGFMVTNVKFIANITKNLNVDVGVDNLFDKAYEYTEGFFGDGRTFFANIRYDF